VRSLLIAEFGDLPGVPLDARHRQLYEATYYHPIIRVGIRKTHDARSILNENTVMFYTSLGHSESKNPTSSLTLLICGVLLLILMPSMEFGLLYL
jgi:hypothetical protein